MTEIIRILKDNALIVIAILAVVALGTVVMNLIPWIWLTYFFAIIRSTAELFGWGIDLPTIWTITRLSLLAGTAWLTFMGVMTLVGWFKK